MKNYEHWKGAYLSRQYNGWNTYLWKASQWNAFRFLIPRIEQMGDRGLNILEIGAGNGRVAFFLAEYLSGSKHTITVTDLINESVLSMSNVFSKYQGDCIINVKQLDAETIDPAYLQQFDLIYSTGLASALSQKKVFDHISRHCRSGQILITDIINPFQPANLKSPLRVYRSYVHYERYKLGLSEKHYHFGICGLSSYFQARGLKVQELIETSFLFGMYRPFFVVLEKQ